MSLNTVPGFGREQTKEKLAPYQRRCLRKKIDSVLGKDGRKFVLKWAGDMEYLKIYSILLEEGLVLHAKSLADYLFSENTSLASPESLQVYQNLLERGFYNPAKSLADQLLRRGVSITSLRFRTHDYFEHLGYLHKSEDRINLAFIFDEKSLLDEDYDPARNYLFYKWLTPLEEEKFDKLKQKRAP